MSTLISTADKEQHIRLRGEQLAKRAGFRPKQLYTRNSMHDLTIIRGAMIYQLRWSCGYKLREIGAIFNRSPYTCCYWTKKLNDLEYIQDTEALHYINYIKP